MKIIIQKFGGTSLSSKESRQKAVEKIVFIKNKGYSPVVVVSAMGRKGDYYSTDTLLSLLNDEFIKNNKKAVDLLLNTGEIISSVIMCKELYEVGISAMPMTGGQAGIITDNCFGNAKVLTVKTNNILEIINYGKVPVVSGFQGETENGDYTTIGRGGSDTTAAILGSVLKAERIEIYTDVDGIMTADPKIVKEATLIEQMSYDELFNLAALGAKVIHQKAAKIAADSKIPLTIKNTFNYGTGTSVSNSKEIYCDKLITAITHIDNRVQISIFYEDNKLNNNYFEVLNELSINDISIDLINVFTDRKIFTIDQMELKKLDLILKDLNLKYNYRDNCSKISLIGSGMRGIPGIMAKILKTLKDEKIEILQTSDSHTTIWCLIPSEYTVSAIIALHNVFN
jgi:aspartate kinase